MVQAAYRDKASAPFVERKLIDLHGIGKAMLKDFELLGVRTVKQLAAKNGEELYQRLNTIKGVRQDPCVLDTLRCAVAQAQNPNLPPEQTKWWYWSRKRLAKSA